MAIDFELIRYNKTGKIKLFSYHKYNILQRIHTFIIILLRSEYNMISTALFCFYDRGGMLTCADNYLYSSANACSMLLGSQKRTIIIITKNIYQKIITIHERYFLNIFFIHLFSSIKQFQYDHYIQLPFLHSLG